MFFFFFGYSEAVVKHSSKRHDPTAPNEAQKQLIVWFKNKSDIISRNMARRHKSDRTSTDLTEEGSCSAEVEFHHSELSSSLPEFPGKARDFKKLSCTCIVLENSNPI